MMITLADVTRGIAAGALDTSFYTLMADVFFVTF